MAIKHPSRRRRPSQSTDVGAIDPTENVKALSEALSDRQDDLRELNNKYLDARLKCLEQKVKSSAKHQKEMRDSESKRLDAIRATDVAAVSTTAAQSLAAIQALASTATATAETLRNQVSTTATTIASQTDRIVGPIMERIAALEKSSYTGLGKQAMSDPMLAELVSEMKKFAAGGERSSGKSEGVNSTWALIIVLVGLALGVLTYVSRSSTPPLQPQPIIVIPPVAAPSTTTTTTVPVQPVTPLVPR